LAFVRTVKSPRNEKGPKVVIFQNNKFLSGVVLFSLLCFLVGTASGWAKAPSQAAASRLQTRPGFQISVYAERLGQARGMAFSPEGILHVCDMKGGRILALLDHQHRGNTDEAKVVIEGLRQPHSLAFQGGYLYVGETHRISRFNRTSFRQSGADGKTITDLPEGGNHFTRTIVFGPDEKLYVSIGSTCNACVEKDARRATICRCNPDGSQFEVFATGLRNAVGMAFQPSTNDLWASVNGRDYLGDDLPPETFCIIGQGKDYGWPYSYSLKGKIIPDPDWSRLGVRQTGLPAFEYQAHTAPLGIHFYAGSAFPVRYQQGFFICFHGSWNRRVPSGYKVVFVPLDQQGKAGLPEDFLTGFLKDFEHIGRPVDVLTGPKGELFISDDYGGRIFKITYAGDAPRGKPGKKAVRR
jgi:glucose/arabinose dehydrogenase